MLCGEAGVARGGADVIGGALVETSRPCTATAGALTETRSPCTATAHPPNETHWPRTATAHAI